MLPVMSRAPHLGVQRSLFDAPVSSLDGQFTKLRRTALDETAWLDWGRGWVRGADSLSDEVLAGGEWAQPSRHMYQGRVLEPRLTSRPWTLQSQVPLRRPILEEMRQRLSARYGVEFDS